MTWEKWGSVAVKSAWRQGATHRRVVQARLVLETAQEGQHHENRREAEERTRN